MNFSKRHLFSITLFACLSTMSTHTLAMNAKVGDWEWTTTYKIPGTPISVPAAIYQSCISKNDLVPRTATSSNCKLISHTIEVDRVDWIMECTTNKKTFVHTGYLTYNDTTAMGVSHVQSDDSALSTTTLGSYIGPCN